MGLILNWKKDILKLLAMIRFKIDSESTQILDKITNIYELDNGTLTARIAVSISIEKGRLYKEDENILLQDGKEYLPTSNIFGRYVNNTDNYAIYKAVFDQHYNKTLSTSDFIRLYKLHLKEGLVLWNKKLDNCDITRGEHISFLLSPIKKGLTLKLDITVQFVPPISE